jgi:hypothetical protein
MLIVNGSELSRRVVRNRGSIDSRREEGKEDRLITKVKSQKTTVLCPGRNPGT